MYTKLEVEQETYMQIELMEESMVTPKGALLLASCKGTKNKYQRNSYVFIFIKSVGYKL